MTARPILLYDGDCGFCAWWVRYWQRLTGAAVTYRPYQESTIPGAELSATDTAREIHWFGPDGEHLRAAAAAFAVLAAAGAPWWQSLYRHSRAFAAVAEQAYRQVARRRDGALAAARFLWGAERHPPHHARASALFIRLIGFVYIAAFASLATQASGLWGEHGILPATRFLAAAADYYGAAMWYRIPSVFWIAAGNDILVGACLAGCAAAALAVAGQRPMFALLVCYVLYLSLFGIGQDFMHFQWDLLLLEAGFLAIFLPLRLPLVPFLFRLLLFRFMLLSGTVKLLSGDPTWAALSALDVHFFTQPLPSPLAWYAHQLPAWIKHAGVGATFVIELILPWLIFAPRRPRMLAAAGFIGLEIVIALTGNYNFFNLLTIALVVFLFDDAQFPRMCAAAPRRRRSTGRRWTAMVLGAVLVPLNVTILLGQFMPALRVPVVTSIQSALAPFRICNAYGLFANMTTTRPEIELEASMDGRTWQAYEFRYKPGSVTEPLAWIVPHQPRLDWQMWFAALGSAANTPWFGNLLYRLLQAEPAVLHLFEYAPFGATAPRYVRARLDDYRFTTVSERARDGALWVRQPLGLYHPAVALQ